MRGRGSFQFTTLELFALAAGFAVASLLIFVLGVVVGREVAYRHSPLDVRVARLPVEPADTVAVAARPKAAFARLSVPKPKVLTARTRPPSPTVRTASKADRSSRSVADRDAASLQRRADKTPTPEPRAATVEVVVARTERRGYGAKVASSSPSISPSSERRRSEGRHGSGGGTFLLTEDSHAASSARGAVRDRPSTVARIVGFGRKGVQARSRTTREPTRRVGPAYTVQVLSTRDAGAAESLVRSLKARGLGAYVRPAQDSTGRWFRVRIGRFGELGAARTLATRCRKDLRLDQAYVVSD